MFGKVLGHVEYPDDIVRQTCICVYSESDLKCKDLTLQKINCAPKLLQP